MNNSGYAQEKSVEEYPFYKKNPYYAGLGVGYDFGGIGGKLEYMFLDYGGLFLRVQLLKCWFEFVNGTSFYGNDSLLPT